ncbi:MAG: crossover junction endodeoxyribonuclease RuvC [Candidatus Omnitrophica bacterium]|nr:crossover junction endodeoxyribonuclease RuvC [Candidatus Omnitrophota bacterium]
MRILGVDPALSITGYGVIEFRNNRLRLIEAGVIRTDAKCGLPQRLHKIYRSLFKLIDETRPDVLVLEKLYAHYRHPVTAYQLAHARGVVCLLCADKNIPLIEYAATRVRKGILGRGNASKFQVQKMVMQALSLGSVSPKYLDVTDALALALVHTNTLRSFL